MRISKKVKYLVSFILTILIIFIYVIINMLMAKIDDSDKLLNNYTNKNYVNIDFNNDSNNLSIINSDISKNTVILAGESHGIEANLELQLELLKHFNQNSNLRYLLIEMGYSFSCYINEYLESGDEEKLRLVFDNLNTTYSWSKEYYNFWLELRKYNLSLKDNQRIKVIGIDIEHQIKSAYEYLNYILPSANPPAEIELSIKKRKLSSSSISTNDINSMLNLQNHMKSNPNVYMDYLGDKYFDFTMIVDNIVNTYNAKVLDINNEYLIREQSIYNNFKKVYEHFPKGKYFGQFGIGHVYQKTSGSYTSFDTRFAMYLNSKDSPVQGKVLSIAYVYTNSLRMAITGGNGNYAELKVYCEFKDIDIINKYNKTDITLMKLNGKSSPFIKRVYFIKGEEKGNTTDYFQYIILVNNSKATTPFK